MKLSYSKPHLNYHEQVELLQSKNLIVNNVEYAALKLSHIYDAPLFNMGFPEKWEELDLWKSDDR